MLLLLLLKHRGGLCVARVIIQTLLTIFMVPVKFNCPNKILFKFHLPNRKRKKLKKLLFR